MVELCLPVYSYNCRKILGSVLFSSTTENSIKLFQDEKEKLCEMEVKDGEKEKKDSSPINETENHSKDAPQPTGNNCFKSV